MITVFYDGKCGLCRREIEHYKRIAPANIFVWVDITVTPEPFTTRRYTVSDGLKRLHVEDSAQRMHQGVAAFAVIWRQLAGIWPWLARLVGLPFVGYIAEKLYTCFAAWRFKKLGYDSCDI